MTHDYKRHGTTTLFAAFNVLEGKVISRCMQRHRHEEFIRFLAAVDREVPAEKTIEAIVDNYATHNHRKVRAWLKRHRRWTFHFTPTSAYWLNAVENVFSTLTRKRIRRGSFHSIVDLQAAINRYLAERNANPKPFVWTASAPSILAKLDRSPGASVRVGALACGQVSTCSPGRRSRPGGSVREHGEPLRDTTTPRARRQRIGDLRLAVPAVVFYLANCTILVGFRWRYQHRLDRHQFPVVADQFPLRAAVRWGRNMP